MTFYDFNLFDDNISKTMILIIKTVNENLKKLLEVYEDYNGDVYNIIKKIYQEFIISVITSEYLELEKMKIINIFKYILYSFIKHYKFIYFNEIEENKNNLKEVKNKFINTIRNMQRNVIEIINKEEKERYNFVKRGWNYLRNNYYKELEESGITKPIKKTGKQ